MDFIETLQTLAKHHERALAHVHGLLELYRELPPYPSSAEPLKSQRSFTPLNARDPLPQPITANQLLAGSVLSKPLAGLTQPDAASRIFNGNGNTPLSIDELFQLMKEGGHSVDNVKSLYNSLSAHRDFEKPVRGKFRLTVPAQVSAL